MTRRTIPTTLVAALLVAAAQAAIAAEEATVKAVAAWVGKGNFFLIGETEALFIGAYGGVLYVESEEGALDAVKLICPGTIDIDLESGAQEGSGKCIATDVDNDHVFAEWECAGKRLQGCEGSFTITSGTGKFEGITGESPLKARTALSEITANLKSGAVAESATGLLVLPELTYNLP